MSFPNQKKVVIHKTACHSDFLQINNYDWHLACRALSPAAFKLYLYLSANKDGFPLWLSREAAFNAIGICKTAYYNAIKELEKYGYLIARTSGIYEFSTIPIRSDKVLAEWRRFSSLNPHFHVDKGFVQNCGNDGHTFGTPFPSKGKEIYKNIDNNKEITNAAINRRYGNFEPEPFEDWFARLPESERDMKNPAFWFGKDYDPDTIPLDWPDREKYVHERTKEENNGK